MPKAPATVRGRQGGGRFSRLRSPSHPRPRGLPKLRRSEQDTFEALTHPIGVQSLFGAPRKTSLCSWPYDRAIAKFWQYRIGNPYRCLRQLDTAVGVGPGCFCADAPLVGEAIKLLETHNQRGEDRRADLVARMRARSGEDLPLHVEIANVSPTLRVSEIAVAMPGSRTHGAGTTAPVELD